MQIEVVIADSHSLVRKGLKEYIPAVSCEKYDLIFIGEASSGCELLKIYNSNYPDLIITEIALGCKSGFDVLKEIKQNKGKTKFIYYTSFENVYIIHKSIILGAHGYVHKNCNEESFINSLRTVLLGKKVFPDISRYEEQLPGEDFFTGLELWEIKHLLSKRELELFRCFGRGMSINDSADKLYLCRKSIEYHEANIKYKLKLKNQNQLVRIASRFNLIDGMYR